jgi:glyoxylase-like metal-dependent hydrolase (beta-lactamase superfamily II)
MSAPLISRRRFLVSTGLTATAVCLGPRGLFGDEKSLVLAARNSGETAKITVQALRGNVSALIGAGGNIAVLPVTDGKLIIDAGYATARDKIADALTGLGPDPIKHLINTHWHFDHTDGNEWMHSAGAAITAHENTRKHLSTSTRVEDWNFTSGITGRRNSDGSVQRRQDASPQWRDRCAQVLRLGSYRRRCLGLLC